MKRSFARQHAQASNAGLTLLELLIALSMGGTVIAALASTAKQSGDLFTEQELKLELDSRLARATASSVRHLMPANSPSLLPDLTPVGGAPAPWSNNLRYRAFDAWTAAGIQWSAQRELRWELDPAEAQNDLDDDGDGLVDEGVLVWLEDEGGANPLRAQVVSDVAKMLQGEIFNGVDDNGNGLIDESGASFEFDGRVLTLHMTLESAQAEGPVVQRTRQVRVQLRN